MCQPRFFPQFMNLHRDLQSKIEERSNVGNLPRESCEVKNVSVNETSKVKDTVVTSKAKDTTTESVKEEVKVDLPTVTQTQISELPTRCDISDVPFVKITQPDVTNEITFIGNETPSTSDLVMRKPIDLSVRNSSDLTSRKSSEFTVVVNMPAYTNDVVTVRRASDQEVRKLPDRPGRRPSDLAAKKSSDTIVRKSTEQSNIRKPVDPHVRKNSDLAAKKSSEVTVRKSNEQIPLVKISSSDVTQKEIPVVEPRILSRSDFSKGPIKLTNNVIKFPSLETPEKVIEPVVIEQNKTPTISLDEMINFHIISPARSSPVSLGLLPTLSTYSSKLCHRCVQSIPEGVPSILFHNRTYHSKCYYCSHCRVSLFEHRAFHHQNDLYCADCHFVINIEFTPPKK
jgi:bifunctional DNA-binding transcriptional regulator/antitoxin component of YhaV-PrlF toxin-antitoxin module